MVLYPMIFSQMRLLVKKELFTACPITLQAVQNLFDVPLNLMIVSPAHTPHWDMASQAFYFYFAISLINSIIHECERMLDSIYFMTLKLGFGVEMSRFCHMQRCYGHYFIALPKYLIHKWFINFDTWFYTPCFSPDETSCEVLIGPDKEIL